MPKLTLPTVYSLSEENNLFPIQVGEKSSYQSKIVNGQALSDQGRCFDMNLRVPIGKNPSIFN